jgi:DNA polymerase III gamma/tau subunit
VCSEAMNFLIWPIHMPRWLLAHPESNCLFEVSSHRALQQCCEQGCDDVSGLEKYETAFQLMKSKPQEKKMTTRKVIGKRTEVVKPTVHENAYQVSFRPKTLAAVIGHKEVIKSLERVLDSKSRQHSFLFTGQKGIGKTTLARILATEFNCDPANITEVDAATTNGVDDMRELTATMQYNGFGEQPNKMFILDECHMLSKQAWGALLKSVEEPPEHVFFVFCTTEEGKVPDTIVSRCVNYNLKPLRHDDIMDILEYVRDTEDLKVSSEVLNMIARASEGSPRLALTQLSKLNECTDQAEAAVLLEEPMESAEIIDLCRVLVSRSLNWKTVQTTIKALNETTTPESTRIVIVNYLNSCLLNAKSEKDVPMLLDILASFSKPCNSSDKWAGILLSLGNFIFPA